MQLRPAAAVAAKDVEGRLLLVRRRDDGTWCLPGGHFYSDPATQTHVYPSGERCHFVGVVFEGGLPGEVDRPDREVVEAALFARDELPEPLMDLDRPPIADALSSAPRPFVR